MNFYLKLKETIFSVAPIMLLVLLLGVTIAPLGGQLLLQFMLGGVMVIIGLAIFLLGVDIGIIPVGERSGAALTSKRNLPLLLIAAFFIGFIVTIAEPDIQVLADQVRKIESSVSKWGLIIAIAAGVGLFVALGIMRVILSIPLRLILIISYIAVFGLAGFAPQALQGVAFDSGGATTGPMTVPFILALGVGVAAVRRKTLQNSEKNSMDNDGSFGLTGIASVGPVLAVIIFAIVISKINGGIGAAESVDSGSEEEIAVGLSVVFAHLPAIAKEVVSALAPLAAMAVFFQITLIKMPPMQVVRMIRGFVLSFIGLVIFLGGAQGGFMPVGQELGVLLGKLAANSGDVLISSTSNGITKTLFVIPKIVGPIVLILIGCIFGAVVVCAEPAVWVLTDQVEEISGGMIRRKVILVALSAGVAISIGISMARVLYGFSLWFILLPGYVSALALSFWCPKLFTGIAFDSGGVASGPMTSTFILSLTIGVGHAVNAGSASEAFGVIALVAMTPLIAIQILGIVFKVKTNSHKKMEQTELLEEKA